MNKFLSLIFCMSLVLPLHGMDIHLVENPEPQPKLTDRVWRAITCNKVISATAGLAVLALFATCGYFLTTTCFDMKGVCTTMQTGCKNLKDGCTEMKISCKNCTTNFAEANCGLKTLDAFATLIEMLIKKYPQVALDLALEIGSLNTSLTCH